MAKHNDNRLAPTLLVGLGGQGCKIVARVSQLANEEQKKYLSFVAFDTDVMSCGHTAGLSGCAYRADLIAADRR